MDVNNEFLAGSMTCMWWQPPGIDAGDKFLICKLNKAL
jgi:hypothetical protein